MKGFIFSFVVFAVAFVVYVRWLEETNVFFPSREMAGTPRDKGLAYDDVSLQTPDGVLLHGWFVTAAKPDAATLLFFHGNAGNIFDRLDKIFLFHRMGLNVLIIDYRGYGKSAGKPSEQGLYQDALAAFEYLARRPDVRPERIVVYGESLGGVAAIDLAARRELAAVIIDSSFSSAADMAKVMYPFIPSFVLSIKMDSVAKVRTLQAPKLFLHSPADATVPFALGRKLFEAAAEPKEFVRLAGPHNNGYVDARDAFMTGIRDFLLKWNLLGDGQEAGQ
jgi:hypothetical protein